MEKAFKTYNGGKSGNGTYQTIINQIPPINIYIEPMIGNGGVFCNLNLPRVSFINDIDFNVSEKYNHLQSSSIIVNCKDYKECISEINTEFPNTLIYFDPPYMFETRKSKKPLYKYEWSNEQHIEFLSYVGRLKCLIIISHYPCALYNCYLSGWRTLDYESMSRTGLRTERLYMNYQQPTELQDYRYIGQDFTDRQRIKRKVSRLLAKLKELPPLERSALLQAVKDKYNYQGSHSQKYLSGPSQL